MAFNFTDIVALAKAGYKPSEVKELLELASSQEGKPADLDNTKQEPETKGQGEGQEQSKGTDQPEDTPVKPTDTDSDESAILSYKKKIEELEGKISKLQSDNVHTNNEGKNNGPSDEELLNNLTRDYM